MDTKLLDSPTFEAVRETASEVLDCLQQAHFAARRLEGYLPFARDDRLVDRIHAARVLAHQLAAAIPPVRARRCG